MYFIFPPHLTCFRTTRGNRKPENCIFSFKCMLFTKNTWNTLKYHLVTAEAPFTVKRIDWMHQTGPRSCCLLLTCSMLTRLSRCRSLRKRWELFLVKPEWKSMAVLMGYLSISSNVDAIKHITDDHFSFRKTAHWCTVRAAQSNCCSALD